MIIVEGPDGSGKSTTIEKLGYKREHIKSLRGGVGGATSHGWHNGLGVIAAYSSKVREAVNKPGHRIAFDRFHLSEAVYGPILRNRQEIGEHEMLVINHMLRDRQIPLILCLPPFETTLANVMQEGRPRPEYQTVEFLREAYREFQKLACWATIVYDYTRDPLPGIPTLDNSRVNGD